MFSITITANNYSDFKDQIAKLNQDINDASPNDTSPLVFSASLPAPFKQPTASELPSLTGGSSADEQGHSTTKAQDTAPETPVKPEGMPEVTFKRTTESEAYTQPNELLNDIPYKTLPDESSTKPKRKRKPKKVEAKHDETPDTHQDASPSSLPEVPTSDLAYSFDDFKSQAPKVIFELIKRGLIDQAYVKSLQDYFGVANLMQMYGQDTKLNELFDQFVTLKLIESKE